MSAVQQKLLDIFFYDMDELSISTFYKPKKPKEAQIILAEDTAAATASKSKGNKQAKR